MIKENTLKEGILVKERKEEGQAKPLKLWNINMIWFGAAISLAEILTGAELGGMGFSKGLLAILLGHGEGIILMILTGLIGAYTRKASMASTILSFGTFGAIFFALLNIVQLVGWQGIMIYDASVAAHGILPNPIWAFAIIIGALTVLWIVLDAKKMNVINAVTMIALLVLSLVLCYVIFIQQNGTGSLSTTATTSLSFGMGLELSIAMPLSWLPMISDYTSKAEKPVKSSITLSLTYGAASIWMYVIGLGAACFTGEMFINNIMVKAGLGVAGLIIVVFSCVTTNFIDAFSCGASATAITKKISPKLVGILDTVIGTIGAIIYPMDSIAGFLYFIGSVFAPMIAIQITDFFILRHYQKVMESTTKSEDVANDTNKIQQQETTNRTSLRLDVIAGIAWLIGFIGYRLLMKTNIPIGYTIPDMALTSIILILLRKISR